MNRYLRHIGLLFTTIMLFVNLLPYPVRAQGDPSPAPYLFYFDYTGPAWVIERADGSDRHTLGADVIPEGVNEILGPGWSSSGEWFAWTAAEWRRDFRAGDRPFLVSADGAWHVAVLDDFADAVMLWSPTADLLLVAGNDGHVNDDNQTVDLRVLLIDPATDSLLVDLSLPVQGKESWQEADNTYRYFPTQHPILRWTADGSHAVVALSNLDSTPDKAVYTFLTLTDSGEVLLEHIVSGKVLGCSEQLAFDPLTTVSTHGDVLQATRSELIQINLISGTETRIPFTGSQARQVLWSPVQHYGLVQIDDSLWLLATDTGKLTPVFDALGYRLSALSTVQEIWSPDGVHALFPDDKGQMVALDASTGEVTSLGITIDVSIIPVEFVSGVYTWHWIDTTHVLIATAEKNGSKDIGVYRYAVGGTAQLIAEENIAHLVVPPSISPDGTRVAEVAEAITIYNLTAESQIVLPPDSRSYHSAWWGETAWHTSGDWLLLYEDALVAGAAFIRWIGVASADGAVRRELGLCAGSADYCIGWLPPQVNPASLPPDNSDPPPQPEYTLTTDHWSWVISWSPDGTRLVAGGTRLYDLFFTGWDVVAHTEIKPPPVDDQQGFYTVEWLQDTTGDWTPTVISLDADAARIMATSPDGSLIVEGDCPTTVNEAESLAMVAELGCLGGIMTGNTGSFSPDGRYFVAGNLWFNPRVWDTASWAVVAEFPRPGAPAFSPDGSRIAVSAGWSVQVWDFDTVLRDFAPTGSEN